MTEFPRLRESRHASGFELRLADADSTFALFRGYASVTDHPYDVYGGPNDGGWTETIARGAFKRTLGIDRNRALLKAHNNADVVATTRSGTLSFVEDSVGLLAEAKLDTRVSWIADLAQQIETAVVDEMSIGFYARGQQWNRDYTQRTITEVELVEGTIVWAGANPATVGSIERMAQLVTEARAATVASTTRRVEIAAQAALASLRLKA
ncbi:HK97 family phage prohead protease [bacterium]|nr:HK97 family phage prohead protease [bacterium]NDG19210.1 HK97 family phage prohead protease [Betaproteobacteria bacterium]